MNQKLRFFLALACALPQTTFIKCNDSSSDADVAADHGTGVLKEITNRTAQPILIRFADSAYPPLKANDSTESFGGEDLPLKAAAVGGSMVLMGIVGMLAMKSNPTNSLSRVQERINKPAEAFASKVSQEKDRLNGTQTAGEGKKSETTDETVNARAAAEKKWADFSKKHREAEDAELETKLKAGKISPADIIKIKDERKKADEFQDKMSEKQKRGGLLNTLWVDTKNTKNDLQNEKENFSKETNQLKGMMGLNTAQEREEDKAFYQAFEKMTPSEKKAAQQLRDREKAATAPTDKSAEKAKFWASARDQGGFNNPDGSAMSKAQMTKTVLGRMVGRDGKKEPVEKEIKTRKQKIEKGLKYGAVGTIAAAVAAIPPALVALSEQIGDTPANIMVNMIPWEIPDGKFRCPIKKNPLLVGFGSTLIPMFPEGGILKIKRMLGLGAAWLQNPLPTPLSFTLSFKVRILDEGGAHIMLREGLDFSKNTPDDVGFKTKIILGGFDNTVTAISDKGTLVAKVSREEYAAASIPPGIFTPYWLSYDKGLIMVGLGQPGTNVILSWHDPDFSPTIDHIGLSCDKSTVEFTELYFSPAIASTPATKRYVLKREEITLQESTTWLKEHFREPGSGSVSFQKQGASPTLVKIALSDDNDSHIKIPLGSQSSESILLCSKNPVTGQLTEEEIGVVCDPYPFNENEYQSYWVSNLYGQISVGHSQPITTPSGQTFPGHPGTNLIACVTVPTLAKAATIGFAADPTSLDKKIVIKNIGIHPATELQENIPLGYVERRKFSGILQTIYPFAYQFRQAGQSIEVHDQVSGETWYPAATPQQMATYFFNAIIDQAGSISMKERGSSKNPIKFGMAAAATALQQAAGLLNTAATQVGQSGTDIISQIITAGISIGLASTATGVNISAGILSANAKYGFRDQNSYVYIEKVTAANNTSSSLPEEVQAHKTTIEGIIAEAATYKKSLLERFDFNTLTQANIKMLADGARAGRSSSDRHAEQLKFFELYVTSHKQILSLINHPSIGSNPMIKKNFAEGLFFINQTLRMLYSGPTDLPQKTIMTDAVIGLFIEAQQNTFLLNDALNDDRNRAKLWTTWTQEIAGETLNANATQGFSLSPMFGQYLWLNEPFILPNNNGSIYIEAQGLGDLFVGIIDTPAEVRNTENDLYEIVFGGSNNTKTFLRIKSLGRSVAEISNTENIQASVDPLSTEKFWVSIKNNTISAGKGEWGTGKLLEWTDPYPLENARRIGISSWNNPLTIKNVRTGPAVEDLTPEIRTKILGTILTKKISADEIAKKTLMKETFTDLEEKDLLVNDVLKENDFEKNDRLGYDMLMMPEADQLTHDILQDTIDRAAGGKPKLPQLAQNPLTKDKKALAKKSDKPNTAAEQKQQMAQMATGGLGGLFQEKQQLFGKKLEGDKTAVQKARDFFRKRTNSSKATQTTSRNDVKTGS